jgi:A/G-specific adenine glycosylase
LAYIWAFSPVYAMKQAPEQQFATLLLTWNRQVNTRAMPWKGEKDPYLIWLSEIILQQTRVEQGLEYFLNFKKKYPAVKYLAQAPADEVMRLWQGLGYYSRARNLHETAKNIQSNYRGRFPESFDELKKLKGVGEYTAAAIASFAFGIPKAVVDGNVIRVLSRVFGVHIPFDTTEGKKRFAALAQELMDEKSPGEFNQAMMDFGATVCAPQKPDCEVCPFKKICSAYNEDSIDELPVRQNKIKIKERWFNYLLIKNDSEIFIEKRTGNDIWKTLYQLPMIETEKPLSKNFHRAITAFIGHRNFVIKSYSKPFKQMLTHRKINARFIELELKNLNLFEKDNSLKVSVKDLPLFAFPKMVHLYLKQNSLL